MVCFIEDADEAAVYPADNFLGLNSASGGSMELSFENIDGTLTAEDVILTVTDADGVGFKRAAQAVANAMGGYAHGGKFVKIADSITGEFIHADITAVNTV